MPKTKRTNQHQELNLILYKSSSIFWFSSLLYKRRPHKIAKNLPLSPFVRAETPLISHQKVRTSASDETPLFAKCPHWTTSLSADVFYGQPLTTCSNRACKLLQNLGKLTRIGACGRLVGICTTTDGMV